MYDRNRSDWRADVKWLSGILLVLVIVVFLPVLAFSQLSSRERAVPLLESVLRLTLLPPGSEGAVTPQVREDVGYTPGEPLELLPGTGIFVPGEEVGELTPQAASERIATVLSDSVVEEGADAVESRLQGSELSEQFERALDGSARDVVRATLLNVMMPAGLENGSRLANWRLQAQQNPGEPVQPIVGVFVRIPPAELQNLTARQIGERVVTELADLLLSEGLAAASEQVTNVNLTQRLEEGANGPIRDRLQELFATLLVPYQGRLAERADQARAVLQAQTEGQEAESLGVATAEELAGLDPQSANELVLRRLAERGYEGGSSALLAAVTDTEQASRVAAVSGLVDAISSQAHSRYLRLSWILGLVALLLLVALSLLSRGWGRLGNPGLALALAAAGGALLTSRLAGLTVAPEAVTMPTSVRAQGVFGYLLQLLAYAGASLPEGALELVLRIHLAVLVLGAALVLLSLLLRLVRSVGPRRRSLI